MFASPDELLKHLVTVLPPSRSKADELFRNFQEWGYVARQEFIGMTVMPKMMGANLYVVLGEGAADAPGQTQVVMLSSPFLNEDEFDSWVDVVRAWAVGLDVRTKTAFSRMIRELPKVEDGIPLHRLHKELPSTLLFSYARRSDYVIVIHSPGGKRKIFATKNIG